MMASALLAGSPWTAFADTDNILEVLQNSTVRGKVVDASGEPVIGASVVVKGTTVGVITDLDGNFILNNVSEKSVLVISYVGYKSQEIAVSGKSAINVTMQEDSEMLDEVVVVGYGAMKKSSLTGSVTVVDSKIFENKGSMSNPLQALQGQAPGVRITRSSSAPGEEGWGVSLRGAVSKNTTEPLLIIDGVPSDAVSDLQYLNPSDIETMNFLKDASAAIYGAKAAGGVIIVTTKRPQAGKLKIEYNGSNTRKMPGLQAELMSLDEWAGSFLQAMENDGLDDTYTWYRYVKLMQANKGGFINVHDGSNPNPIPGMGVNDYVFHDVNWTDVMWGPANSTQHDLSFSGGNEKVTYRLSAGYLFDDSNLRWGENNNQQYTFRSSNVIKATDRLTIESVISAVRKEQVTPTQIGRALNVTTPLPGRPVSTIDGKPYLWGTDYTANWLLELGGENKLVVTTFNLNETLKYQFTKELTASATFGYSTNSAIRDEKMKSIQWYHYDGTVNTSTANPYPTQAESKYTKRASRTDNYSVSGYLNYAKTIGKNHNINVMAGYSWQHFYYANHDITYSNPTEDLGAKEGYTYDENERHYIRDDHRRIPYENYLISFFGRLNYNFMDRYLLTATLRRDGSSRFSENNRWGLFPSAALAWTISNEPFMKATENVLSKLKLRLGYGVTGQQEIGDYQYITSYSFSTNPNTTYLGTTLLKPNGYSPDLKWEQTTTYNVAIDFGFLNNRINGSIEYYQKHTKDLLNTISAAAGTNFINLITANVGKMKNKGVEANVNAIAIQSKDFTWEVGYNITWNDSKITKLTTTFNPDYQGIDAGTNQKHQVGEMPGTFYLYQQVYDENGKPIQNAFVDRNNDGQITEADRYLTHKSPMAKVYMGFSSQFSYKKWDLGFNLRANFGNYVYNGVASGNSTSNNYGGKGFITNLYNGFQDTGFTLLNTSEQMASDYFLENASFLKMDNLTLGYSFQNLFAAKLSGRISASVQNVFTISKYSGLDPECGAIDSNIWPRPRTYTIGLNLNF